MNYENKLKDYFTNEELEWRVQQCGVTSAGKPWVMALCYIQARAIQDRLDSVFGVFGWKDEYRHENGSCICRLSVKDPASGEWITKENGAEETDIEAFKGGISSAFKRVASSGFGIGRYLYKLDTKFAVCDLKKQNGWERCKTKKQEIIYWQKPMLPAEMLPEINSN